jgi:hypothetical protein
MRWRRCRKKLAPELAPDGVGRDRFQRTPWDGSTTSTVSLACPGRMGGLASRLFPAGGPTEQADPTSARTMGSNTASGKQ